MARRPEDRYANIASATSTEDVAGTLKWAEIITGISLGQGVGLLVDQVDYIFDPGTLEDVIAAADVVQAGWSVSSTPGSFSLNDRSIVHHMQVSQSLVGAVVSQSHFIQPFQHQFFPPIPLASPRIYFGVRGISLAGAAQCISRLYFRYIELTDKEYLELAETFILVG